MAVYTVHEPPLKRYEALPDPDQFRFVRDGFSFWAFVLGPLWMLRHRMWLVLLGYLVTIGVIETALYFIGASATVKATAGLLVALLVGIEAGTLRRFTLGRRGWSNVGLVVGDDIEVAERRFFDAWVKGEAVTLPQSGAPLRVAPVSSDVIGLFPQPGAQR